METSERGRIIPPDLDDRRWRDLVDEMRSLIPTYAPQWTDHSESDLGITLIELFAYLVEGLTYRLNRVPEKNYLAFLNLLGIKRDPATPARAFLTFTSQPGPPVLITAGRQAQTRGEETVPSVIFETDEDLTVLPINMRVALHIGKLSKYSNVSKSFTAPPAEGAELSVAVGQSVQICFGFDQTTIEQIRLLVRMFKTVRLQAVGGPEANVSWVYSQGVLEPGAWPTIPGVDDETVGLTRAEGAVRFSPPLDWARQRPSSWTTVPPNSTADTITDDVFWIGIRIANVVADPISVGVRWVLFNSVSSHNAPTIPQAEQLPGGDGTAFQVRALARYPIFERLDRADPFGHLDVRVNGVSWTRVEELPAGAAQAYRLDPVAGEILFGNFDPVTVAGNGDRPPSGASIAAQSYRYAAGGVSGNVGAAAIRDMRTPVSGIIGVTNLFSAYGASDEEAIEETKRRAPEALRNRHRAVTAEDYEFLGREATTDVALIRCLEPRIHLVAGPGGAWAAGDPWTFAGMIREPGNVHVLVVPHAAPREERPEPTLDLLREVQAFLDRRRDVTARLRVVGPSYLPIRARIELRVWQRAIDAGLIASAADVTVAVRERVQRFLHPTRGGVANAGWKVGEHVYAADVFNAVKPSDAIGFLADLRLEPLIPPYHDPPIGPGGPVFQDWERPFPLPIGTPAAWVRLADYELVCFGDTIINTAVQGGI